MKNSFNTSIDIFILIVKIKVLIFSKFRKNLEKFLEKTLFIQYICWGFLPFTKKIIYPISLKGKVLRI